MRLNDKQYEQVAQWLDAAEADRPALDDALRAAAEEIVRHETDLAGVLRVDAPPAALIKARARMLAELSRPRWATRWVARTAAAAAIVAIFATVAAIVIQHRTAVDPRVQVMNPVAAMSAEAVGQTMARSVEVGVVDLLADELANLEAAAYVNMDNSTINMRIDAIEDDLLEGTLLNEPTIWLLDDNSLSS